MYVTAREHPIAAMHHLIILEVADDGGQYYDLGNSLAILAHAFPAATKGVLGCRHVKLSARQLAPSHRGSLWVMTRCSTLSRGADHRGEAGRHAQGRDDRRSSVQGLGREGRGGWRQGQAGTQRVADGGVHGGKGEGCAPDRRGALAVVTSSAEPTSSWFGRGETPRVVAPSLWAMSVI